MAGWLQGAGGYIPVADVEWNEAAFGRLNVTAGSTSLPALRRCRLYVTAGSTSLPALRHCRPGFAVGLRTGLRESGVITTPRSRWCSGPDFGNRVDRQRTYRLPFIIQLCTFTPSCTNRIYPTVESGPHASDGGGAVLLSSGRTASPVCNFAAINSCVSAGAILQRHSD